ncbi:MAG: hypothetical protein EBQ99_06960 [Planctomycetes bacterium]|nr:hypothetical protein [Planctomycetota bacterium]
MNTTTLTERLLQAFPSGSFCLPAMLELASIEETDAVPTAAVECVARPRLLLNPTWIAEHAATPEKLVMLTLHELHHVVLGHTRLYPRLTPLDNLVFDAVINSMLCHLLPERACMALMTDFYSEKRFPECFLRPPERWKPGARVHAPAAIARDAALADLYTRLYSPAGVGYEELREALKPRVDASTLNQVTLLGDHRDEGEGASSGGELEIRSPALLSEVRRIVERWPQPPTPIRGRSLADIMRKNTISPEPASNAQRLAALLRRVGGDARRGTIRHLRTVPHPAETPLPTLDRRSSVLRRLGAAPLLHRTTVPARQLAPSGDRVHVYLDVSGSLSALVPSLYGAVLACRALVHPVVHLFSTRIHDVSLEQLKSGTCKTTGGTCIECVGEHMAAHRVRRAVLVTDGYVGRPGATSQLALMKAIVGVAITPGLSNRDDLNDVTDHWADLS